MSKFDKKKDSEERKALGENKNDKKLQQKNSAKKKENAQYTGVVCLEDKPDHLGALPVRRFFESLKKVMTSKWELETALFVQSLLFVLDPCGWRRD